MAQEQASLRAGDTELPLYPFPRQAKCPFDPPPELDRIQAEERCRRVRIWNGTTPLLVTGFALARDVLADPRLSSDTDRPGFPAANPGYVARRNVAKAFVNMDSPRHDWMRRTVTQDFTAKRAELMRPKIQEIVDDLIEQMLAGPNPTDLVQSFSLRLPSLVICEILGVPLGRRELFFEMGAIVNSGKTSAADAAKAQTAMVEFLGTLVDQKLAAPQQDLISRLAVEYLATGKMTRGEVVSMCNMIMIGGFDTTSNMIALGTLALLEHSDVLEEIRTSDDPAVIANGVEELLRWLTILHLGRRRVALEDLEIEGHLVRAGEGVIIAHDVANRDPVAFESPHELDIHQAARHHLAFGYGIHQCLGQSLARVELQVVYGTLYRRVPTLALAIPFDEVRFKNDSLIYGVHELPITW